MDLKKIQIEISDCDGKFFATSKQVPGFVLCSENRMALEEDIFPAMKMLISIKAISQNKTGKKAVQNNRRLVEHRELSFA